MATEIAFVDQLLSRPVFCIYAHGTIPYSHNKGIKLTALPTGMLALSITTPGQRLQLIPHMAQWFLSRAETRLNTFIPLFAAHSMSDLYGQMTAFWNIEDIVPDHNARPTHSLTNFTVSDLHGTARFKRFHGKDSEFEGATRARGGAPLIDLTLTLHDPVFEAVGAHLGVYEFSVDGSVHRLSGYKSKSTLSKLLKTFPPNALVVIMTCSSWELNTTRGGRTNRKLLYEEALNNPATGPALFEAMRRAEEMYHANDAEYRSLPLVSKGSAGFRRMLDACSPIVMPNLTFRFNGERPANSNNRGIAGPYQPVEMKHMAMSMKGGRQTRRRCRHLN